MKNFLDDKPTEKQIQKFTAQMNQTFSKELETFLKALPKRNTCYTNPLVDYSLQIMADKLFARLNKQEMSDLIDDVINANYNRVIETLKTIFDWPSREDIINKSFAEIEEPQCEI